MLTDYCNETVSAEEWSQLFPFLSDIRWAYPVYRYTVFNMLMGKAYIYDMMLCT